MMNKIVWYGSRTGKCGRSLSIPLKTAVGSQSYRRSVPRSGCCKATISGDAETVAELIEQAHQANASILKYNDENALSCVISLAYYSAQKNYTLHREMPAGKGFADIVFEPNRNCDLPALIVELKWGHSAEEAVEQIKQKDYLDCLKNYSGEVLLVGVNYDKEKRHTCRIERAVI